MWIYVLSQFKSFIKRWPYSPLYNSAPRQLMDIFFNWAKPRAPCVELTLIVGLDLSLREKTSLDLQLKWGWNRLPKESMGLKIGYFHLERGRFWFVVGFFYYFF